MAYKVKACAFYHRGICDLLKGEFTTCVVERGATDNCPAYTDKEIEEFFSKEEFAID